MGEGTLRKYYGKARHKLRSRKTRRAERDAEYAKRFHAGSDTLRDRRHKPQVSGINYTQTATGPKKKRFRYF